MTIDQKIDGILLGLRVIDRGMDFAIAAINDVKVMIKVFIEKIEEERAKPT